MSSLVLDLDTLGEQDDPALSQLYASVGVPGNLVSELRDVFGSDIRSEVDIPLDFELSNVCESAWSDDDEEDNVKNYLKTICEQLNHVQMSGKSLLFHSNDSQILVAHYRENNGWVNDSGNLISGKRIDSDSVISMFILEKSDMDQSSVVVDVEYYTRSIKFMKTFNVLSEDRLHNIPYDDVYLEGAPHYDERYTVSYSFGRDECARMISEGVLDLELASNDFSVQKQQGANIRDYHYDYLGGRFGINRSDSLSGFEKDYIKYTNGCLTSSRIYDHLVTKSRKYREDRSQVYLSDPDETIHKREGDSDELDVVFSKSGDDGSLIQEFADQIVRSVKNKSEYWIYFASHRDQSTENILTFESSRGDKFRISNMNAERINVDKKSLMDVLYEQATDDDLGDPRRYQTAATLLAAIGEIAETASAESLAEVPLSSSYPSDSSYVSELTESNPTPDEFAQKIGSYFENVGIETQKADIIQSGFDRSAYERLLDMVDDAGNTLELNAGDFRGLGEESYRSILHVGIDNRIDGSITRESETRRGPSDLRLSNQDGDVVYIGECKYWRKENSGVGNHVEKPLDQLSTYDQNQRYNSIIIFFNPEGFSTLTIEKVWERVESKIFEYDEDATLVDNRPEHAASKLFQVNLASGGEPRLVSVHIFNIGAEQHHSSDSPVEEVAAEQ